MWFVIMDGLPYLLADGDVYSCRFDENGLTIGAVVHAATVPDVVYSERSIMAQCAGRLDSIGAQEKKDTAKPTKTRKKKAGADE